MGALNDAEIWLFIYQKEPETIAVRLTLKYKEFTQGKHESHKSLPSALNGLSK